MLVINLIIKLIDYLHNHRIRSLCNLYKYQAADTAQELGERSGYSQSAGVPGSQTSLSFSQMTGLEWVPVFCNTQR